MLNCWYDVGVTLVSLFAAWPADRGSCFPLYLAHGVMESGLWEPAGEPFVGHGGLAGRTESYHFALAAQTFPPTAGVVALTDDAEAADVDPTSAPPVGPDTSTEEGLRPFLPTPACLTHTLWNPLHFLHYLFFAYVYRLLRKSAQTAGRLDFSDLWNLVPRQEAKYLTDRVWVRYKASPHKGISHAFIHCFAGHFLTISFLIMVDVVLQTAAPFLLILIVVELNADDFDSRTAYLATTGLSVLTIVRTIALHMTFFNAWRVGHDMRTTMMGLVFRKAINVGVQGLAATTTGQILNLISNDAERFVEFGVFVHFLWLGPLQLAVVRNQKNPPHPHTSRLQGE